MSFDDIEWDNIEKEAFEEIKFPTDDKEDIITNENKCYIENCDQVNCPYNHL